MSPPNPLLRNVFLKTLRDQVKAIAAWGGGLALLAYGILVFYPAIQGLDQFNQLLQQFPQLGSFLGDVASFTTLEGYITSQLLILLPLILGIYAILTAAGLVADEITRGTMDFLLGHPLPRWRVVVEKYAALVVALLAIGLLIGLGLWLGALSIAASIPLDRWLLAALNLLPLTLLFGSLAFVLVCALRGRAIAVGIAATVAIGGFVLNGLAPFVAGLRAYREWTIYYLFAASKPLSEGINWGYTAILLGASLLCLLGAMGAFSRRDIRA